MVSSLRTSSLLSDSVSGRTRGVLRRYASRITVDAAIDVALKRLGKTERQLDREGMTESVAAAVVRSLSIYLKSPRQRIACRKELMTLVGTEQERAGRGRSGPARSRSARSHSAPARSLSVPAEMAAMPPVRMDITVEVDVVRARRDARALAMSLGFDHAATIKIATAVSEVARNIISYASSGFVEFGPAPGRRVGIRVLAADQGPGISNLQEILDGNYRSRTGMGLGIRGSRNIMDEFKINSTPGKGTRIEMVKYRY